MKNALWWTISFFHASRITRRSVMYRVVLLRQRQSRGDPGSRPLRHGRRLDPVPDDAIEITRRRRVLKVRCQLIALRCFAAAAQVQGRNSGGDDEVRRRAQLRWPLLRYNSAPPWLDTASTLPGGRRSQVPALHGVPLISILPSITKISTPCGHFSSTPM